MGDPGEGISHKSGHSTIRGGCECEKCDDFVKKGKTSRRFGLARRKLFIPPTRSQITPEAERMRKPSRPRIRRSWQEGLKIGKWGIWYRPPFDKGVLWQPRYSPGSLEMDAPSRQGARVRESKKRKGKKGPVKTRVQRFEFLASVIIGRRGFLSYHTAHFPFVLSSWVSSQ